MKNFINIFLLAFFLITILFHTKTVFAVETSATAPSSLILCTNSLGSPVLNDVLIKDDGHYISSQNNSSDMNCTFRVVFSGVPTGSTINYIKAISRVRRTGSGNENYQVFCKVGTTQQCLTATFVSQWFNSASFSDSVNLQSTDTTPTSEYDSTNFIAGVNFNNSLGIRTIDLDWIQFTLDYTPPPSPTSTQTPTPTPVTPTPTPSILADFKQTDPQWSTGPNLPVNLTTRLNHSLSCGDMYGYGCAVTSVANVFYSYGKTVLSNTFLQLNPGTLNDWLSDINNSGFNNACSIIWANVSGATQLGAPQLLFRNNDTDWAAGQQAIDNALNIGNLPIVGVYTNFGTHFFVVAEKLPDVNGKPDYKIIDPALYPFVENTSGKTGQALSQSYGGWDQVFETIIYEKDSLPQNALTIRAHSPVQLLITDPLGNATGYDNITQEIIESIPDSVYGMELGIAPVDGLEPAQDETKYFQQTNPTEGIYEVTVIGTGEGVYTLDFSKIDEEGNIASAAVKGFAQTGVRESYQVVYSQDANENPMIEKQVTFDTLISDIEVLYLQDRIKSEGFYRLLFAQAKLAQKASLMRNEFVGEKLAMWTLKAMQFEMNRQMERKITEDGYEVLNYDIDFLLNILRNS